MLDISGDYTGPTGSGGDPWPNDWLSPKHVIEIHDLFHAIGSDFLDDMTQGEFEQYELNESGEISEDLGKAQYVSNGFFNEIKTQENFILPLNFMLAIPQISLASRARSMELNDKAAAAEEIQEQRDFLAQIKYVSDYDNKSFIEYARKSIFSLALEQPVTLESFAIDKTIFRDWLQYRYDNAPEKMPKPGKHEFATIMDQIGEILGVEKKRGTGWAQRQ